MKEFWAIVDFAGILIFPFYKPIVYMCVCVYDKVLFCSDISSHIKTSLSLIKDVGKSDAHENNGW